MAQITSHHFNVKGETFNAYGAVSLSYRIPEGGNTMINHVMASDPVSAASPHFGQVRIYAKPDEIKTLAANGFSNHALRDLIRTGRSLRRPARSARTNWATSSTKARC